MQNQKALPLIKGAIRKLAFLNRILPQKTGGTIESRYCYSVWMRHLKMWSLADAGFPKIVAELGPGDSLGIGLAALLSGCNKIYAFDVVKYWNNKRNIKIFDELVELFKQRAAIPSNKEYPLVKPELVEHTFLSDLLSDAHLKVSLDPDRIASIRNELAHIEHSGKKFIEFYIPWNDASIIEKNSVDFIYSQAVLECIEDLESTFYTMNRWLKPFGIMSHTIDFKSHGMTKPWNGHWTFSEFEWNIVKGGRPFLINRQPFSHYIDLHHKHGFKILSMSLDKMQNSLSRKQLSSKFRYLNEEDLTTSGMHILSQKV